jgi:hypothetical protein
MNRLTRLRRTGILCMHFVRNAAYYRAWNAAPAERRREQFWRTLNGNFIDICILEWCKLFGDLRAQHHWSKSITDPDAFLRGLYNHTGLNEADFEAYRVEVREYRDKFVAHLDELNQMRIPNLQPALDSVRYLYQYLLERENDVDAFQDAPRDADARYQEHLREGRGAHRA